MYLSDMDVAEICTALSIDAHTLRFYIFGPDEEGTDKTCWKYIKNKMKPTAMGLFLKNKVGVLEQTAGLTIEIVNGALMKLRDKVNNTEEPYELSVDDISKLAKIAVDMDKLYRLESGQATEIIDNMGLSIAEAREVMANDPFAKAVDVEFTTLPWLQDGD